VDINGRKVEIPLVVYLSFGVEVSMQTSELMGTLDVPVSQL